MSAVAKLKTPSPKDLYELGEVPPLGHVPVAQRLVIPAGSQA